MPFSVAGLAADVLAALDEFFRAAAIFRQGEFAFLVIVRELLPFGDEGCSVILLGEKNTGDDYGEECAFPLFYLAIRALERNHRELKRALGHFIEYHRKS